MIQDLRDLEEGTTLEADLCIAGGGAAGITLALECARQGLSVILLEGGGIKGSRESQDLYRGTAEEPLTGGYPAYTRVRHLGGTTNHWVGCCLPLDRIDFRRRHWLELSGWPFDFEELGPFYKRAAEVCHIDPQAAMMPSENLGESEIVFRKALRVKALRFGSAYQDRLESTPGLDLFLHANVVAIRLDRDGGRVDSLEVATLDQKRFRARARAYVLALGAIENARLMLCSRDVQPEGVGNAFDLVGRHFMDHPVFSVGEICVRGDSPLRHLGRIEGGFVYKLASEVQARERLLNCQLDFRLLPEVKDNWQNPLIVEGSWQRVTDYLAAELEGAPDARGSGERSAAALYRRRFDFRPEPTPTPMSRVLLGEGKDPFGNPWPHVVWRMGASVFRTVERTAEIMGRELGRLGYGRLRGEEIESVPTPGYHHSGTTRMAEDPRVGVVDRHGRVHSVANLYAAGSSTFPTCGASNPTLTIVALTLRLADHLSTRLRRATA